MQTADLSQEGGEAMTTTQRKSRLEGVSSWFDPRWRDAGTWAFILNRITALGLTLYLFLHLIVLSQLARGPEAYDGFLDMIRSPIFIFGEWLVVAAGLIHGLNGIRVALTSFGIGVAAQKQIFFVLMVIAIIGSIIFGYRMFTA
jgi:succinate dehydrogenase / fumarate reductase cytochrome b subunit